MKNSRQTEILLINSEKKINELWDTFNKKLNSLQQHMPTHFIRLQLLNESNLLMIAHKITITETLQ